MIGIDICSISRFSNMKNLDKFLKRYFTNLNIDYILKTGNRDETIAGIFSLKEAFVKAIGTGFGNISPIDVEIIHNFSGKPDLIIHNEIIKKIEDLSCSVSHDSDYAIAVVDVKFLNISINTKNALECKNLILNRKDDGHKGDFGKVGIIGGSIGMCGSVDLCAKASLRTGSGLVYNICPNSISDILQIKAVENIVLPISDDNKGCFTFRYIDEIIDKISNLDAIAIGCGLGRNEENAKILEADAHDRRGIFPLSVIKESISCWDISSGPGKLIVGDGVEDLFYQGYDELDGQQRVNVGNFGMTYDVIIHTCGKGQYRLYFNPLGGIYEGVFTIKEKSLPLVYEVKGRRRYFGEKTIRDTWPMGVWHAGQDLHLHFVIAGATYLPFQFLLVPIDA